MYNLCIFLLSILFVFVNTQKAPAISETFTANIRVFGEAHDEPGSKGVISQCLDKSTFFLNITLPMNERFPKGGYAMDVANQTVLFQVLPRPNGVHVCECHYRWFVPYFWWLAEAEETDEPRPNTPKLDCWGLKERVEEDVCFLNSTIKREYKFLMRPLIDRFDYDTFTPGKCVEFDLPKVCEDTSCPRNKY